MEVVSRRRYLPGVVAQPDGARPCSTRAGIAIIRYRYRGAKITTPWTNVETVFA